MPSFNKYTKFLLLPLIVFCLITLFWFRHLILYWPELSLRKSSSCPFSHDTSNILLIVRTGSSQIYSKLPVHIFYTLQCASQYLLFSDVAESFGTGYQVLDALVGGEKKIKSPEDLKGYHDILSFRDEYQDPSILPPGMEHNIDKYKFIPMTLEAYNLAGDEIEWFIFIDDDTYLSWHNLVPFLKTLDSNETLYIGSTRSNPPIAHGGSGYVVSRPTMQKFFEAENERRTVWQDHEINSCCGDETIAYVFRDVGVTMSSAYPHFQRHPYNRVVWDKDKWHRQAITWHHMSPPQIAAVWKFEVEFSRIHGPDTHILFSDYYGHFIEPFLSHRRMNWDNRRNDPNIPNIPSEENTTEESCVKSCEEDESCLQWNFQGDSCVLYNDLRVGHRVPNNIDSVSGWIMPRIQNLVNEMKQSEDRGWNLEKPG